MNRQLNMIKIMDGHIGMIEEWIKWAGLLTNTPIHEWRSTIIASLFTFGS